jgi:hypothetical protein
MLNARNVIRSTLVSLTAAAAFAGTVQAADAAPAHRLTDALAELWTTVLQTPSAENPYGSGGAEDACWDLGGNVVAPFGPSGVPSCTVKPGTRIFVAGHTVECSTFEQNVDLVQCARDADTIVPTVTLDGRPLTLTEVETSVLSATLPADNIFGLPAGEGEFAAHGWVTLLHPLTPGTHTIEIALGSAAPVDTTIEVVPPGRA